MLILFDHVTPAGIARFLPGHTVSARPEEGLESGRGADRRAGSVIKAKDRGWDTLSNGELLSEAERAGFDVLLTADRNMRFQQNLAGRKIAIVVLSTPQWPVVRLHPERIAAAVKAAAPGSYTEVRIPVEPRL